MSADVIERIETRIAFLEQATAELSDEVVRQRREIEALRAQLLLLAERLQAAQSEGGEVTAQDERPPHY
jgi:uncharacterized coiled-coil protein SlyX